MTNGDERTAIEEIARNPVMLAQAREALPMLKEDASRPAGPEGVRRVVGRLLALLPPPQLAEPEWRAWWADYFDVLEDLPEAALEAARAAYIRDAKTEFMPKPGKLRALALETPNMAVRAYDRARKAVEAAKPPGPLGPRIGADEVRQMLAEYKAGVVKRTAPKPPPPVSGEVDGTGLTAAMRELMGIPPLEIGEEGE